MSRTGHFQMSGSMLPENTNQPSSEGTFLTPTPQPPAIDRWIKAKARLRQAKARLRHTGGYEQLLVEPVIVV